jgi:hypothetical protein
MIDVREELEYLSRIIASVSVDMHDGSLASLYKIVLDTCDTVDNPGTRREEVKLARQIAHAIAFKLNEIGRYRYTLKEIGNEIGQRHHATVLHSVKQVSNYLVCGYINDMITRCAVRFDIMPMDLIIKGEERAQMFICAYKNRELVGKFENRKHVVKGLNLSKTGVDNVLRGYRKTTKGYTLTLKTE